MFRTFAELDERYPIFLSTPSESDPALACLPLVPDCGEGAIGCLAIGFAQARDFSPGEVSFLAQLAAEISGFIGRQHEHRVHAAAAERQLALARAAAALKRAGTGAQVWEELVAAAVASIVDGASVHVVEGKGRPRFVLIRHRDPEREAAATKFLQRATRREDRDDMVGECARTGQASVLQSVSEEAIAAGVSNAEEVELLRQVGIGAVGVVPVLSKGKVVAVLSFANNVGRFVTDEELGALQWLAGEAGGALAILRPGTKARA
ncbi:MAG: GAF domain-containing protein [Acidimicrobiales bacterium]